MKKFFCFALALMMLFAFAACSNSSDGPGRNTAQERSNGGHAEGLGDHERFSR